MNQTVKRSPQLTEMALCFTIARVSHVLAVCLACCSASAQTFPYTAYVTDSDVYVRSGPGQRYYPTGQVSAGFAVEVYRHDEDGWCAIRPPEGSFSWVSSHHVRTVSAGVAGVGVAEVIDDNVVTRVGSTLSPNRSAVQVLLPRGEQIELMSTSEDDDPRWVRIAAPAGEFRWIAANALSRQPPIEAEPLPKPKADGWSRQSPHATSTKSSEPNAFDHLGENANDTIPGLQFGAPQHNRQQPTVSVAPADPNAMDVVTGSPAELQLTQFQAQPGALQPTPPSLLQTGSESSSRDAMAPRVRFRGMSVPTLATVGSVEELELRLSQTVVQPPKQWELDPLEAAANSLLSSTKEPSVRAQLREVLTRITRFQQVQDGYENPGPTVLPARDPFESPGLITPVSGESSYEHTGLSADVRDRVQQDLSGETGELTATASKPLYDATGMLKPVVSKREKAPQYALVDDQGKVVSFVTPAPDLNLQPYIGRRIGVHGTRGYMPEYRRAHVTAGRVTPIEGTLRR